MTDIPHRAALITGAGRARGIAAGIALGLAHDGWDLALSHWRPYDERVGLSAGPQEPQEIAERCRAAGSRVVVLPGDLQDPDIPGRLVAEAAESLGPLSGLVLSHCESVDSGVLDTTVESFDRHYAVNVRASWLLLRAFAVQLPRAGGRAVALTSDHTVGNLPYGATKGALDRILLAAPHELADRGLIANVVNPGPVDTGWMDEDTREALTRLQPTGRLGTLEDTADLVRFLLSPAGGWINGQLLHSNGGFPRR